MAADELIGVKKLAEELEVHPGTIHNWRSRGEGPRAVRLAGGKLRFRRSDVEAWLEAQYDAPRPGAA